MKSSKTTMRINVTAIRIISGFIIAVAVSMLITNAVMTIPFIMGIALSILGVTIIVLVQRHSVIPAIKKRIS